MFSQLLCIQGTRGLQDSNGRLLSPARTWNKGRAGLDGLICEAELKYGLCQGRGEGEGFKVSKQSLSFKIKEQNCDFLWVPGWKQNAGIGKQKTHHLLSLPAGPAGRGTDPTAQLLARMQPWWTKLNERPCPSPRGLPIGISSPHH